MDYDTNRAEIVRQITAQKAIYKFRVFLYSLNKDIRQHCFAIARDFLINEHQNNSSITVTEKERVLNLLNHWQWSILEHTSSDWWHILSVNHAKSITLMTLIHLWIDDIHTFDMEAFETSTLGLR